MSLTKFLKIFFLIVVAFAVGEIIFTIQHYGLPTIDFFKPKPGSCKILEEKFCSLGKFVNYKSIRGQEIKYIAFDLNNSVPILSPINGQAYTKVQITQPSPFQGTLLSIGPSDRSLNYNFTGDLKTPVSVNVKTGEVMGTIGATNAKEFGQYNLIFTVTRIDPTTKLPVTDEATLKKLFPNLK